MSDTPTYHKGPRNFGTGYDMMDRIEVLEAKLKDAMEEVSTYSNDPHLVKWARTTLAELKGQDE